MKEMLKKAFRSALSLMLVACLILGMSANGLIVLAADGEENTNGDKTINYVSLGDSMTNGYGLEGYNGNVGVEDYGKDSYANKFAEWLGAEHAQLAMSAMRAEDLHWLLEVDYKSDEVKALLDELQAEGDKNDSKYDEDHIAENIEEFNQKWYSVFTNGDYWTWRELVYDYRFDVAAYCIEGKDKTDGGKFNENYKIAYEEYNDFEALQIVAAYYQESVKNADVISLGMGNGNFGVFMFGRLLESIGFDGQPAEALIYNVENAIRECSPELQAKILELKNELYAAVEAKIGQSIADNEKLNALANTVVYTGLSYVLNYAGSVEAMLKLNPDAEIVLVALMNTMETKGEVEGISLGDVMGAAFVPLNGFIAALPTVMQGNQNETYKDAKFYFAEAPYVECIVDTYEEGKLSTTVRDRFYQSIVMDEKGRPGMVWGILGGMELVPGVQLINVTMEQIKAYEAMTDLEKLAFIQTPQNVPVAVSASVYLAFESAVIASKNNAVTLDSVMGLGGLGFDMFKPVMDGFMANATNCSEEQLEAVATFVWAAVQAQFGGMITQEQFIEMFLNEDPFLVEMGVIEAGEMPRMLLGLTANLSAALQSDETVSGLLALFGRCVIGNGIGSHPSATGHDALFAAVKDAYENEYTAAEKTLENVLYLITTYYDEAYAYAYAEAVKAGYIEEAVAYIDALIAEIEALNLDEVEMTDAFRAEANALRAEIMATLGAAKALLIEADVLDQASLNALLALLNKAGNAMWQLTAVLEQAAIDVNQLAIIPALKAAHDELMNEVLPAIDAALQKAVAEGTAWLMAKTSQALKDLAQAAYELALEAAPEIADAVYDYLYNNPEEVIAFFAEYGDEMLYLVGEYGDEVLMVVAYVAYNYGPEIAEFVIENHETILKAMINWLEVHGENTAALLQVYAEALGLCDAVREQIEILENAVIELNKQAEAQIAILEAEIAALKAQLENASAELKAEIEAKIAELEAQIEMLKAEVAAKIAEVKAAIAELEAALQAAIEKGLADMAALKEAIENLDEKVLELIAAAKKTAIEEIIAATEKVQAALENLDATVEELAGEVYEELKDLLANAVDALIEATIEAAKKYAPEIADAIYNYLYNNPEEVIAFFTEYGDEMLALVEEYGDEALMVIGYFLYLYGEDIAEFVIENHEEILAGICAWIDVHGENTAALLQVYAETLGLCDAVRDQIADLEAKLEELQAELEELKAQLENAANELNEEILAQIEKVEQEIAKVEKALEELKEQLEELYNQIVEIAEAIKEVAEAIKNLNDIIEGKIEGSINEAIDNVQDALEHLADVLVAVEELVEQINEMIDELQEIGEKIDNAINEMIETVEEIKAAIEELNEKVEETIAKIEAAIEEIEKAADELIAEAETALEALKEMAEELKDAVNAAIEDLIAKVREAYENAIRADYEIDRKSYYVGIGDDSAVADGYVEKLAEALGMTERFNNLAQEGLTVEDAFALIQEEMAEIAKADLITIGFNNVAATTNMFNTIAGMGKVDTDWMGLLGAEYTTYVDEALAEINAKLLEEGLDEATAALLTEAVNAYAYTYASRELYYPELVNAIHEISPEALVVIVGTYNDLEGVVLDMGGTEIAVGEYVQYLIDAANLQNLIYAMLTENTIYVDAPAVDTLFEEAVAEGSINVVGPQTYIFALMMGYMNPSETGHEYIKDQILNALNVTRATKLGDVNHDGLVDVEDAMLIQQYDAFLVGEEDLDLSVADVSGDGVVDVEDAMLIQQYDAFIIDVFPAEEEA